MRYEVDKISDNVEENMLLLRNLTKQDVNNILNADSSCEEDIYHYKNIELGINRLEEAIRLEQLIAIIVDDDVDGFASASMVYDFLYNILLYDNVVYALHSKAKQHGFTFDLVEKIINSNVKLVIIPDAGSNNYKALNALKLKGIDVLILDHHDIEIEEKNIKKLKNTILINNQYGEVNNIDLSGTGVAYKFIKEYAKSINKKIGNRYIDLVAVSIISDLCNMKSLENRYYYNVGCQVKNITNSLLLEFCNNLNKSEKDKLTIEDIGFGIAPYINAIIRCGTVEDKEVIFNAFNGCEDLVEYKAKYRQPKQITYQEKVIKIGNTYKRQQKTDTNKSLEVINQMIKDKNLDKNKIIVVDVTNKLNSNLKGLVCNKLLDKYKRPILLTSKIDDEKYGGSSRGYTTILSNLKEFCKKSKLFLTLEGHPNSHGHTLLSKNIPLFVKYANENITEDIELEDVINVEKIYEEIIPLEDVINISKYEDLWCNQIKPPQYLIKDVVIPVSKIRKFGNSTYKFLIDNVLFEKDFGSKVWYQDFIKQDEEAEIIKANILVEFRLNKRKKPFCKIISTESFLYV